MAQQIPLGMNLPDNKDFATFFVGSNTNILTALNDLIVSQDNNINFIYLWGECGVGKTHLLQAATLAATQQSLSALYLSLENITTELLDGLDKIDLICLDNIGSLKNNNKLQIAIFNLFNEIKQNNGKLLVAADVAPKYLAIELADLKSRFSWGVTYCIKPLPDEDKLAAMQQRANMRGISLSNEVGSYLLTHCERQLPELFAILDKLDVASLEQQRRLTIPFVKEVLDIF